MSLNVHSWSIISPSSVGYKEVKNPDILDEFTVQQYFFSM
jgi:hypothetical protein